jgi:hypothetical protein
MTKGAQNGATPTPGSGDTSKEGNVGTKAAGSFFILTADKAGNRLNPPDENATPPRQNPSDANARNIIFSRKDTATGQLPRDQIEVCDGIEKIIHALNFLYPAGKHRDDANFRLYYVRVFGLAKVALEKGTFDADFAKKELALIERDLIDDKGPYIKNKHIKDLLRCAAWLSIPAFLAYVVLCQYELDWLQKLHANRQVLANFMLLWLGCFLGVCLSYALRKPDMTLEDLVTTDSDFLTPLIRLAFTGTLAMLLVMLSMLKLLDVKFGPLALSEVSSDNQQMLAFVVGVICGIGEKLLSGTITTKTKALIGNGK